jgi:hypothetical protein
MHVQSMHCVWVGGATVAGTTYQVPGTRVNRGDAVTMHEVPGTLPVPGTKVCTMYQSGVYTG